MRGWLVINTTDKIHITLGGLDGTGASDVDLKLVIHSTDALGPYLRLVANFRMNGVSASDASAQWICTLTSAGLENPEEHDVCFDFDKDAIKSFLKIPGVQELEEKRRIAKEDETFAKHQKRGELWVLRVHCLGENVRSTGFEQTLGMATPAQKAILMDLAQLREVGGFTFHTRKGPAFRRMLKRWEGYMEKLARDAAHVSVPLCAYTGLKTQLMNEVVDSHRGCLHRRRPPQTISSAHSHILREDDTLSIFVFAKWFGGHRIDRMLRQQTIVYAWVHCTMHSGSKPSACEVRL